MSKLSILSWNLEHFNGRGGIDKNSRQKRQNRVERVCKFIKDKKPDVFGLSEVEGKDVHSKMTKILSGYTFSITEGRQTQELLIGVKHGITSFFTQRNEFKRSNPNLRPGALLTVTMNDQHIPILFTHLKSMPSPEGFGLRDAMFDKAFSLKRSLDKLAKHSGQKQSNFIILGDMNTMGMNYEGKQFDIPGPHEIKIVANRFRRRGMTHLSKTHTATFNNGSKSRYAPADLDHVFAADHLQFMNAGQGADVHVGGWAELCSVKDQDKWIHEFSDHAPLSLTLKI
ncbi:MAG: endonuclease/exonuclease/phosphatase family protein [Candidatus Nitronauta litoralis]|uniref:Endonuclease/exonuclease/phosphatase family protein n=1 Tax=Candidatus Nitronauta litoralis TaxID=2705533 RepID=A0A7T0BV61_9BACT|nr:MAG: endonuclease/exonuclease/phosphatase family protein [Candidatus Nitronauta litoralis]